MADLGRRSLGEDVPEIFGSERGTRPQKGVAKLLSEAEARKFAQLWVEAWNAHDLDAVMSRYAADVVLTSPTAARLLGDASGRVVGRDAVRRYFERGLEAYPELRFELLDVMWGISTVVLYYVNQKGTRTAEFMELNDAGNVVRVVANYN